MTEQLTGYEASSVAEVGAILDAMPADADEVYLRTMGYSERAIAAVAAKRAGGGGSMPAVKATLRLDGQDDATGDVVYTALTAGGPGNGIGVEQTTLDVNEALDVTVSGTYITVVLATDGDGLVTSTANEVVAAVNADPQASLLVVASPGSTGAGLAGQNDGRLSGGVTADAGETPFNGCRYPIEDNGGPLALVNGFVFQQHIGGGIGASPHFDTYGYGTLGSRGPGYTDDLHAPANGYYRISASVLVDFGGSDTTEVECVIGSPDRDGDWDVADHFSVCAPGQSAMGTVTHWLAASDRVRVSAVALDGSTKPTVRGAIEMEFVGTGTNPAA